LKDKKGAIRVKRKLIIFDLDDTLLNSEHTASDLTVRGLNLVREMGHLTAFNTARSKMRSADIFEAVKPDFAIYNGGAHITDSVGKTIYAVEIDKEECNEILQEISRITDRYSVQNEDWFYSANEDYDAPDVKYFDFKNKEFPTGAYKIIAHCEEPDLLLPIAEKYDLDFVTYFGGPFCRFTKSGVNKASGSRALAKILGIDMADVIAFGDDSGDLGMIYEAGVGVLMKNAKPHIIESVKDLKNVVVSEYTNHEDGVAEFLAEYFGIFVD
jgi:Cof subfamily protein (haloacid dehalogenase superfamily)